MSKIFPGLEENILIHLKLQCGNETKKKKAAVLMERRLNDTDVVSCRGDEQREGGKRRDACVFKSGME